jgi:hypothetical protein
MPAKNVRKPAVKASGKSSSIAASRGAGQRSGVSTAKKYKDQEDEYASSSSGSEDRPFGRGARDDSSDEEKDEEVFNLAGSDEEDDDDHSSVRMPPYYNLCSWLEGRREMITTISFIELKHLLS